LPGRRPRARTFPSPPPSPPPADPHLSPGRPENPLSSLPAAPTRARLTSKTSERPPNQQPNTTKKQKHARTQALAAPATAATPAAPAAAAARAPTPATAAAVAAAPAATPVRLCIPEDVDARFIEQCSDRIARADTPAVKFSCVLGGTPAQCLDMMSQGSADIASFGASDAYGAYKRYGFSPIAMENYGGDLGRDGVDYYAVAVVNKAFCEKGNPSMADLKGKNACFTGYRRSAGWVLPLGELVSSGVMPLSREADGGNADVTDDAASAVAFFGKTCAPGVKEPEGPIVGGKAWAPLCEACAGDCSAKDNYADYEGAVRCVLAGAGEVGFTKHSSAIEVAAASPGGADLRLLCPASSGGGCKPLSEYASCSTSRVPAHAIVASTAFAASPAAGDARDALLDAAASQPAFLKSLTELGGVKNAVFKKGTEGLVVVDGGAENYFGSALKKYQGIDNLAEKAAKAAAAAPSGGGKAGAGAAPSGWLSPGAAAGLAFGMLGAGAALGAGGMWFAGRRRAARTAAATPFDSYQHKAGIVSSA